MSPDVLLDAETLGSAQQPREEDPALRAWVLPDGCDAVVPDAASMLTVTQGTGEMEQGVSLHQVAVFADADAAVAAADALTATLTACAERGPGEGRDTRYALESIPVGAQGSGFAVDYYGASGAHPLDGAIGRYLATTRRGNAVTVVGTLSGEATVGAARDQVVGWAQSAWELLCGYDSRGC
ncbi:hypothetical protein [uncultured Cellulomonas sp.]|uniref:hypothetical protein n=1 Tax=uncultured Cellulomonas sp. TaxID=189682 RepID=UPI002636E89A|nr:hypothetical protein [uncultured Cellulomonas sp.]